MDAQDIEHVEWLAEERARLIMQNERLQSALKVIHTWATVDSALVPEHVIELCEKVLRA